MWDCTTCFDDEAADEIERRGGLAAIAISHPHYYSGMADWAARFDCPVLLHADDEQWITRPDPAIELWERRDARARRRGSRSSTAAGTSRAAPCCIGATARAAPARC